MIGYAQVRKLDRVKLDLSFLQGRLRLPWVTMVFVLGFVIEAMLAVRLWLQMNDGGATTSGLESGLLSITDLLVSPFKDSDPSVARDQGSAFFEFATLVAVEAYLIGTLAIVLSIVAIRTAVFTIRKAAAAKRGHDLRKLSMQGNGRPSTTTPAPTPVPPVALAATANFEEMQR